jgi:hypothetical protein
MRPVSVALIGLLRRGTGVGVSQRSSRYLTTALGSGMYWPASGWGFQRRACRNKSIVTARVQ